MNPFVAGALIQGGASILGNLFGASSNASNNRTQIQLARENNAWSEQMMQKQMDYNTMMWEKNNAYNSASAQRQRLEAAGFNPYMMMNGGSAGTATSSGGVSLPSPTQPNTQAFRPDVGNLGQLVNEGLQINARNNLAESQANLLDKQSDWYGAKAMAEIGEIAARTDSHTAKTFYQKIQNSFANDMFTQDYVAKVRQNQHLRTQIVNSVLTGIQQMQEIKAFPERNRMQIAQISADIALKMANKELTLRQAKTEFFKQVESSMRASGQRINNELLKKTFNSLVEKAKYDAYYNTNSAIGLVQRIGQRVDNYFAK